MSTHKGSAGFPQWMLSQGPGCSEASSPGRAPHFPNPTAPPPCFPVECALKCDPSLLCPQSWTKVLSGQFWTEPLHKTDTWVFKSKVTQSYTHKMHIVSMALLTLWYIIKVENYSWMNILISSMSRIQWGSKFIWPEKKSQIKFSLANEKEIYRNMKRKNLENTPYELWSTPTPTPYWCRDSQAFFLWVLDMWAVFCSSIFYYSSS